MFKKAAKNSWIGLILGVISWVVPFGVIFAFAAIIFGLISLYYNTNNDRKITSFSLVSIFLGDSSRLIYSYANQTGISIAWIITVTSTILVGIIFFTKRKQKIFSPVPSRVRPLSSRAV